MGKAKLKMLLWMWVMVLILSVPLYSNAFAYGDGGGGGGGESIGSGSPDSPSDYEDENIEPEFRTPDFVNNPPERNPWGLKEKPDHWSDAQWKGYKKAKQLILENKLEQAFHEMDKANLKHTIAKGTGYAATGAGAIVGAVASPAILPTIVVISVVGDGAASTAGSLSEGKSIEDAVEDGVKKSVSSAILSKVSTSKKVVNAVIGFAGSVGYDNMESSKKSAVNHMPPPDFTDSTGHGIYK